MRKPIFDAIRTARDDAAFTKAEVSRINTLLDGLGVPIANHSLIVTPAGVALIKAFEACKLTAYPELGSSRGLWMIGYGATGPGITKGVTWTQAQADARLIADVDQFSDGVVGSLGLAPTSSSQFSAMTSLAYNIGLDNFASSTLLKKHKAADYAGAAAEFLNWVNASGKKLPELVRRRAAEAALYAS